MKLAKYTRGLSYCPTPQEIACAASLAQRGLLDDGAIGWMWLQSIDLSSVPSAHLASLVSHATVLLELKDVSGCDLARLLDSVLLQKPEAGSTFEGLYISEMSLGTEETKALVRAMETRVEKMTLGNSGEMSLDLRSLMEYSGRGKCAQLTLYNQTASKYIKDITTWGAIRGWIVDTDTYSYLLESNKRMRQQVSLNLYKNLHDYTRYSLSANDLIYD